MSRDDSDDCDDGEDKVCHRAHAAGISSLQRHELDYEFIVENCPLRLRSCPEWTLRDLRNYSYKVSLPTETQAVR